MWCNWPKEREARMWNKSAAGRQPCYWPDAERYCASALHCPKTENAAGPNPTTIIQDKWSHSWTYAICIFHPGVFPIFLLNPDPNYSSHNRLTGCHASSFIALLCILEKIIRSALRKCITSVWDNSKGENRFYTIVQAGVTMQDLCSMDGSSHYPNMKGKRQRERRKRNWRIQACRIYYRSLVSASVKTVLWC